MTRCSTSCTTAPWSTNATTRRSVATPSRSERGCPSNGPTRWICRPRSTSVSRLWRVVIATSLRRPRSRRAVAGQRSTLLRADPGDRPRVVAVRRVSDAPWSGDACGLVDAFRSGERSPLEELDATLARDRGVGPQCVRLRRCRAGSLRSRRPQTSRCPSAVFRPGSRNSSSWKDGRTPRRRIVFADRIADHTSVHVDRLLAGGAVPVGLTTASEFGGLNVSVTKLHGVTHNPWQRGRSAGGSSGGSAAAVAGGLVSLATGGDGGGSIRIPAGYTGLLGHEGNVRSDPAQPERLQPAEHGRARQPRPVGARRRPLLRRLRGLSRAATRPASRSIRASKPGLGVVDLRGRKVAVIPDLGGVDPRRRCRGPPSGPRPSC